MREFWCRERPPGRGRERDARERRHGGRIRGAGRSETPSRRSGWISYFLVSLNTSLIVKERVGGRRLHFRDHGSRRLRGLPRGIQRYRLRRRQAAVLPEGDFHLWRLPRMPRVDLRALHGGGREDGEVPSLPRAHHRLRRRGRDQKPGTEGQVQLLPAGENSRGRSLVRRVHPRLTVQPRVRVLEVPPDSADTAPDVEVPGHADGVRDVHVGVPPRVR